MPQEQKNKEDRYNFNAWSSGFYIKMLFLMGVRGFISSGLAILTSEDSTNPTLNFGNDLEEIDSLPKVNQEALDVLDSNDGIAVGLKLKSADIGLQDVQLTEHSLTQEELDELMTDWDLPSNESAARRDLLNSNINYSPFIKAWGGANEDRANGITKLSDGSLAVVGIYSAGAGDKDALLLHINASGSLNWARTWGGVNEDYARAVTELSDGSLVVTGYTYSVGAGDKDALLLHINASGSLDWARTWGGTESDSCYALIELSDSSLVVAGFTYSVGAGNADAFLLDVSLNGSLNWARIWGGANYDYAFSLKELSDGSLVAAGHTGIAGIYNALLLHLSTDGNLNWARTWGGTNDDKAWAVTELSDDSLAVAGYTYSAGAGDQDVLLLNINASGSLNWARTWGGIKNDNVIAITELSGGSLAVVGYTYSAGAGDQDVLLLNINASGSLNWARTWSGENEDYARTITELSDGSLGVAGYTYSVGAGDQDVLLMGVTTAGYAGESGLSDWPTIIEVDVTSSFTGAIASTVWSNSNPSISLISQSIDMVDITNELNETLITAVPSLSPTSSGTPSTTMSVTSSPTSSFSRTPSSSPTLSATSSRTSTSSPTLSVSASESPSASTTPSTLVTKSSSVTTSQSVVVLSSETSTVTSSVSPSISALSSASVSKNTSITTAVASPTPSSTVADNASWAISSSVSQPLITSSMVLTSSTPTRTVVSRSPSLSLANEAPVLVNNTLSMIIGKKVTVDLSMLAATDKETPRRNLEFIITEIAYGKFILDDRTETTVFSQGAVEDREVTFESILLAGEQYKKPFYKISISDGAKVTEPVAGVVQVLFHVSSAKNLAPTMGLIGLTLLNSLLQMYSMLSDAPEKQSVNKTESSKPSRAANKRGLFAVKSKAEDFGMDQKPGILGNTGSANILSGKFHSLR